MGIHFQVEPTRLAVRAEDDSSRQSSDVQSFLGKSSALFSGRVAKALDVGSTSSKSPSADTEKARKQRKAWGSMGAKKPTEGPSSGNKNIDINSFQADVLEVSFVK